MSGTYSQNLPVVGPASLAMNDDTHQSPYFIFSTLSRSQTGGVASDGVYASDTMVNFNCKGVRLFAVVANGSGTVTVKVQVKNPATGTFVDLAGATTAALNNTAGTIVTIYPGLTGIADSAGVTINQHLGFEWRLVATVATAAETFSIAATYLR